MVVPIRVLLLLLLLARIRRFRLNLGRLVCLLPLSGRIQIVIHIGGAPPFGLFRFISGALLGCLFGRSLRRGLCRLF